MNYIHYIRIEEKNYQLFDNTRINISKSSINDNLEYPFCIRAIRTDQLTN